MLKLLFILWVIWFLVRSLRRVGRGGSRVPAPGSNAGRSPVRVATEDMVACAWCGVHFPVSERIAAEGFDFCCVAHRELYRDGQPPA